MVMSTVGHSRWLPLWWNCTNGLLRYLVGWHIHGDVWNYENVYLKQKTPLAWSNDVASMQPLLCCLQQLAYHIIPYTRHLHVQDHPPFLATKSIQSCFLYFEEILITHANFKFFQIRMQEIPLLIHFLQIFFSSPVIKSMNSFFKSYKCTLK